MTENSRLFESVLKSRKDQQEKGPIVQKSLVAIPVIKAAHVSLAPDFRAEQGILARWKAKQMDRKSALAVLETQYAGHLEVVKHNVLEQVKVAKTQISIRAEELLNELDVKHLEIMSQLGMRNMAIRQKMVADASEQTVAAIRAVEGKDWPDQLKMDVITKAIDLKEKFVNKIMAEADFGPQG